MKAKDLCIRYHTNVFDVVDNNGVKIMHLKTLLYLTLSSLHLLDLFELEVV